MGASGLMRQEDGLAPELRIIQVLRVAGGWVSAELYALSLWCLMPRLSFELRGALRSPEALRRLAARGLVEESGGA